MGKGYEWWLKECGFIPPFQLFDEDGEYLNGIRPPEKKIDEYYDVKHAFQDQHPLPVELVSSGSDESSEMFLAVPSSVVRGDWEGPTELPEKLFVNEENIQKFVWFYKKYFNKEPILKWWLAAYWG